MQRITTAQITVTTSTGNSLAINMPPVTFFKTLKLSYDRFQLDKCSLTFIASHSTDLLHPCLIYLTCVGMQPRALSPPCHQAFLLLCFINIPGFPYPTAPLQ